MVPVDDSEELLGGGGGGGGGGGVALPRDKRELRAPVSKFVYWKRGSLGGGGVKMEESGRSFPCGRRLVSAYQLATLT